MKSICITLKNIQFEIVFEIFLILLLKLICFKNEMIYIHLYIANCRIVDEIIISYANAINLSQSVYNQFN